MDAAGIIGLVANIAQFIQIGYGIAVQAREVHKSISGASRECERLTLLVEHIRDSIATVVKAGFPDPQAADAKALQQLANECSQIAADLLAKLGKLGTKKSGWSRRIESVKIAGHAWWSRKETDELLRRLITLESRLMSWWERTESQNRDSLILGSLARLEQRATRLDETATIPHLERIEAQLKKAFADLRAETAKQRNELMLEGLESKAGVQRLAGSREAQVQRHIDILQDATRSAGAYAREIGEARRRFRVLESLAFRSMKTRHENIDTAHDETLNWVFHRSKTSFSTWLAEGSGIYWISGLAGSGKSTMMKFVANHARTQKALSQWSPNQKVVIASHFFWVSGTEMQKSQLGLFQTLMFHILRSDSRILDSLFPQDRPLEPWDVTELVSALARLKGLTCTTTKFCFFIDGLDEYGGEEENIISVVKSLASTPNMKVCASSRPWPAFFAEWSTSIQSLAMQDFTRSDMEQFVADRFTSDPRFQALSAREPRCHHLPRTITERGQGVWLWVQLAVRDLLRDMRDNEPYERLKARLDSYPIELNRFFERILLRIDPSYRVETAQIFLLATKAITPMSILILPLLEKENGYQPSTKLALGLATEAQLDSMYRFWHPRLQNRCRDLMKLTKQNDNPLWQRYQVDFLHRTVRDFLRDHYIAALREKTSDNFDERLVLCKLLLLGNAPLQRFNDPRRLDEQSDGYRGQTREWVAELLTYLKELDRDARSDDDDLKVASIVEDLEAVKGPSNLTRWISTTYRLYTDVDILCLTTAAGISRYTLNAVMANPSLLHDHNLLYYALQPNELPLGKAFMPPSHSLPVHADLVHGFLELGVDPNRVLLPSMLAHPPLHQFALTCRASWKSWDDESRAAAVRIIEDMLRHGATTVIEGGLGRKTNIISRHDAPTVNESSSGKKTNIFRLLGSCLEPETVERLQAVTRKRDSGSDSWPFSWILRYLPSK